MKKVTLETVLENYQDKRCYGVFIIDENVSMMELSSCDFFAMEEEEPKPAKVETDPAKQPHVPKRKNPSGRIAKVDYGRIRALHEGGWAQNKIAEDVGCSESTVSLYLKKLKKEGLENEHADTNPAD